MIIYIYILYIMGFIVLLIFIIIGSVADLNIYFFWRGLTSVWVLIS